MPDQKTSEKWPLGVFTSIDAGFGVHLEVAHQLGVPTMHLHAPHRILTAEETTDFAQRVADLGMSISVVFAGFEGESYADIPAVQQTVGLVPSQTRDDRVAKLKEIIEFTRRLNVEATGLHIGFVPHAIDADPEFAAIVEMMQDICHFAAERGGRIHLETGQEPADVLLAFLQATGCDNLFVNFDPANMILYGCGEPIEALRQIGPYVKSVHCKDATWSDQPGVTWGTEVKLGAGDVDFPAYLQTLNHFGYDGPLTIEREISQEPERQRKEIGEAVEFLKRLKVQP